MNRRDDALVVAGSQSAPLPAATDAPHIVFSEDDLVDVVAADTKASLREWFVSVVGVLSSVVFVGAGVAGLIFSAWVALG